MALQPVRQVGHLGIGLRVVGSLAPGGSLAARSPRALYDRFGAKQDLQRFYENRAIEVLLGHGAPDAARCVVEFGCGTGALARDLLENRLRPEVTYLGLDVSGTMTKLARERVAPWATPARIEQTGGDESIPLPDASCDRRSARTCSIS